MREVVEKEKSDGFYVCPISLFFIVVYNADMDGTRRVPTTIKRDGYGVFSAKPYSLISAIFAGAFKAPYTL